MKTKIV